MYPACRQPPSLSQLSVPAASAKLETMVVGAPQGKEGGGGGGVPGGEQFYLVSAPPSPW